jgi:hypothetical protein
MWKMKKKKQNRPELYSLTPPEANDDIPKDPLFI